MNTPTDNPPSSESKIDSKPATPATIPSLNKTIDKIIKSDTPEEYCRQAGVNLLEIYKELNNIALNAVVVAKDRDGDPIDLGADNRARMSAIALILELNKHIKDKSVVTQVGIFNDPAIVAEANRVLNLRGKL